jgi:hypothetical protein
VSIRYISFRIYNKDTPPGSINQVFFIAERKCLFHLLAGVNQLLRGTVTGQTASPPPFESTEITGRGQALARIKTAIEILSK